VSIAQSTADDTATGAVVEDAPGLDAAPEVGLDHALLSATDEVELAKRMEAGLYAQHLLDSGKRLGAGVTELEWLAADGRAARTEFIEQNLRLALSTARKFRGRGFSEEDLRQDAFHGLVKAVDRFDYRKGFKFSTYAVWWIRESILTGIRDSGAVKHPEALWNQIIKVRAAKMQVLDETGDTASIDQIAAVAKVSPREVERCLRSDLPVSSLQIPVGEGLALHDVLRDDDAVLALDAVEYREDHTALRSRLAGILHHLDTDLTAVIVARYGLDGGGPRNLTAVAAELGLNRQTVRVREQKAMAILAEQACALDSFRLLLN
jgi:RNA polymerase nonessential primary-like sigma factor